MRLEHARLYLILDARPEIAEAALRGGVDIVQLRAKDTPDDQLLETAQQFRRLCTTHNALFIINDSPELAARAKADGVHLGQDDMPLEQARRIVGHDRIIGLSTHNPEQIAAAEEADYIAVGPIHATPTKPGRPAVGLDLIRAATQTTSLPWFAIGGIDPANISDITAAGATRVAILRAIADAADPEQAARTLRTHLQP